MGGKKNKKGANKSKKQQPPQSQTKPKSQQSENAKASSVVDNSLSWRKPLSTVPSNSQNSALVLKIPVVQGFGPSWINGENLQNSSSTLKTIKLQDSDSDVDVNAKFHIKINDLLTILEEPLQLKTSLPLPDTNLEDRPPGFYFYYSPWNARKFAHDLKPYFSSFQLACKNLSAVGFMDFISDADNIKRIMNIKSSEKVESFILHRIGNTVLVDSFDMQSLYWKISNQFWPWFENFARNFVGEKNMHCIKTQGNYEAIRNSEAKHNFFYYCLEKTVAAKLELETSKTIEDSKDSWKEGCDINVIPIPEDAERDDFLTTFEFIVDTFAMKLGSKSPVLYKDKTGEEAEAVSLWMHNTSGKCALAVPELMDIFFDQILLGVNETLVGHHEDMTLRSLQWLPKTSVFKDTAIQRSDLISNGINMLQLVKDTVVKSGHSYWLYKAPGEEHKFVDLTAEMYKSSSSSFANPYAECYASLLYRICLQFCHDIKPQVALKMLDHAKYLLYNNGYKTGALGLDKPLPLDRLIRYFNIKTAVADARPDIDTHMNNSSNHKDFVHVWVETEEQSEPVL